MDKNKIRYQSFEDLKIKNTSNSPVKFKIIDLPISGNFLDIGCNCGYFCFKFGEKYKVKCLGIDKAKSLIEVANQLNKEVYKLDNVSFTCSDFFEFDFQEKYDTIICFSTFHYFRNKQTNFLKTCKKIMTDDGILIIELGISENGGNKEYVQKFARAADKGVPCHFPNKFTFQKWANEAEFKIKEIKKSIQIDKIPRFFYILQSNR